MKEDDLVEALIHSFNDDKGLLPEAHYNHYGVRGFADLCVDFGSDLWILFEVKSPCAVKEATGANEIIRQFNRMRKTFFKTDEREVTAATFNLAFMPSEETVSHLMKYHGMYSACVQTTICEEALLPTPTVTLRSPEEPKSPITIADKNKPFPRPEFPNEAKDDNERLWREYGHLFQEHL